MQRFIFIFLCLAVVSPLFASGSAMPERMQQDWMYQDYGLDISSCFAAPSEIVVTNITDDTSTGISLGKTYTHLLDFGKAGIAGGATVNGVKFQKTQAGKGVCTINGTSTNYGWDGGLANPFGNFDDDPALAKVSGIADLLRDCNYGQKTEMKLTGLTPGKTYEVRIYCRNYQNRTRLFSITFDSGKTKANINYDYNIAPHALTFRYIPQGNSLTIKFGTAKENYDIHALTNEQLPDGTVLFTKPATCETETTMLKKVLDELDAEKVDTKLMRDEVASL